MRACERPTDRATDPGNVLSILRLSVVIHEKVLHAHADVKGQPLRKPFPSVIDGHVLQRGVRGFRP